MLLWEGIGARVDALARATTTEVVVVAPFIKRVALQRVLAGAPPDATVLCVTRWRVDELARGVSDLEVYLDLVERGNARMLLVKQLHAKYFRFDRDVIVGSCNITGAALGYKDPSNLELAVALAAGEQTSAFEARVTADAVPVKHCMYEAMKRIIESMPITPIPSDADEGVDVDPLLSASSSLEETKDWVQWLPACRAPNALYDAYTGHLDDLTLATRVAALQDLQLLGPPRGLTRAQFDAFVAGTILSSPVVARLADFAITPRRFGEMKDLLRVIAPATSATNDWQTTMRWLLHFAPDRFTMRVTNYSEIFTAKW